MPSSPSASYWPFFIHSFELKVANIKKLPQLGPYYSHIALSAFIRSIPLRSPSITVTSNYFPAGRTIIIFFLQRKTRFQSTHSFRYTIVSSRHRPSRHGGVTRAPALTGLSVPFAHVMSSCAYDKTCHFSKFFFLICSAKVSLYLHPLVPHLHLKIH